jgi:hypothetical protein
MTVLEEGLLSYLMGYSGLTALVSTRVYLFKIPQSATLPCISFQRVSTPKILTMDSSGSGNDLSYPSFQFDVWGNLYSTVKPICNQLLAALNGKTGNIGSGANIINIQAALVTNEVPEYDAETNLYRGRMTFTVWLLE